MAAYADFVQWIADNDDSDTSNPASPFYIAVRLVADVFDRDQSRVYSDVVKRRRVAERQREREATG